MANGTPIDDHVLSIEIKASVQRVWDEITKTGAIQRALYNTVLETSLTPGSRLRYYSPDKKRVFIVGEVVDVVPPTKFSHTYMFTQNPEKPTLVTWELEETADGCKVTLTHSGWTTEHKAPEKVAAGWKEILALLKQDIETGQIPLKTRILYRLMGAFMFMMPKTTKVGHVDQAGW
jgi:uncharacterized protein YndB with AHSA1/START domain